LHLILILTLAAAACSSPDGSTFAVLSLLSCPNGAPAEQDGVLLLFNAENPMPVSSWSVKKVCAAEVLSLLSSSSRAWCHLYCKIAPVCLVAWPLGYSNIKFVCFPLPAYYFCVKDN
jgi:hypothetical protein